MFACIDVPARPAHGKKCQAIKLALITRNRYADCLSLCNRIVYELELNINAHILIILFANLDCFDALHAVNDCEYVSSYKSNMNLSLNNAKLTPFTK